MAVISLSTILLEKKTGKKMGEIRDSLSLLGFPNESDGELVNVEVTPNRPDAYSEEGIIRLLRAYFYGEIREYKISKNIGAIQIGNVKVRPYACAAVVENIHDRENLVESLMNLQEKIHATSGRNRKKIAIGVHDLEHVKLPLRYEEVSEEHFTPLGYVEEMSIAEILKKHEKGKEFAHLVKKGRYPILYDSIGVISFPPIINSERTKVTEKTKSMLIDVTGTNFEAISQAMNIILCALSDRGGKICSLTSKEGTVFPNFEKKKMKYEKKTVEKLLGFEVEDEIKLFKKMGILSNGNEIEIPPYRVDFIEDSDIAEEIAVAYGYDKIAPVKLGYQTEGRKKYNDDLIRDLFVSMGFKEVYNFFLVSKSDLSNFGKEEKVRLVNALTYEFNAVKPILAIGLVKTIFENKREPLPLKFFEIGHVYNEKEEKRFGFVIADEKVSINSGLEIIKTFMIQNNKEFDVFSEKLKYGVEGRIYGFKSKDGKIKGNVLEIHPEINEKYNIDLPIIVGEGTLTP